MELVLADWVAHIEFAVASPKALRLVMFASLVLFLSLLEQILFWIGRCCRCSLVHDQVPGSRNSFPLQLPVALPKRLDLRVGSDWDRRELIQTWELEEDGDVIVITQQSSVGRNRYGAVVG